MKLRTCPACGSTDITTDTATVGIPTSKYRCRTCGYVGEIIIELDVEKTFKK